MDFLRLSRWWLPLSLLAILASAGHVVIDVRIGVYPTQGVGLAIVLAAQALVYGVWAFALWRSVGGARSAILLSAWLALIQGTFLNGIPIVVCPPVALLGMPAICPLSPWQDFAHLGSLVFGTLAFFALRGLPAARKGQMEAGHAHESA